LDIDVNMVEEGQVERSTNGVLYSLSEHNMTAIVAIIECVEDVRGVISNAIVVTLHIAHPVPRRRTWWGFAR